MNETTNSTDNICKTTIFWISGASHTIAHFMMLIPMTIFFTSIRKSVKIAKHIKTLILHLVTFYTLTDVQGSGNFFAHFVACCLSPKFIMFDIGCWPIRVPQFFLAYAGMAAMVLLAVQGYYDSKKAYQNKRPTIFGKWTFAFVYMTLAVLAVRRAGSRNPAPLCISFDGLQKPTSIGISTIVLAIGPAVCVFLSLRSIKNQSSLYEDYVKRQRSLNIEDRLKMITGIRVGRLSTKICGILAFSYPLAGAVMHLRAGYCHGNSACEVVTIRSLHSLISIGGLVGICRALLVYLKESGERIPISIWPLLVNKVAPEKAAQSTKGEGDRRMQDLQNVWSTGNNYHAV